MARRGLMMTTVALGAAYLLRNEKVAEFIYQFQSFANKSKIIKQKTIWIAFVIIDYHTSSDCT